MTAIDRQQIIEDAAKAEWAAVWPGIPYETSPGAHADFAKGPQAEREIAGSRIHHLINARRLAFLADALHQGMTGQDAWEWAEGRALEETGELAYDRARRHGVPCDRIKPYPCGPEPDHHDHMASTGDVTGHGIVTRIDCPESECPTCTEEAPNA